MVQRLGDLDHLLLRDAELIDQGARVDVQMQLAEQLPGLFVHRRPVQGDPALDLAAQEDVLGDGQIGDLVEFLVDGDDAGILRLAGRGEVDRLALEDHLTGVALIHAGQDFHQGGFARAVLADKHMDFAPADIEVDIRERQDAGEAFGDPAHFEEELPILVRRSRRSHHDRLTIAC